jgi:molecular chaperone GrpE
MLASLQAKADEHWERYLRAVAEQDNIRKRAERDVEHAHRYALDRFVGDLAPVRESLEMGLQAEASDAGALREGVEMTLKQLDQVLSKHGVAVVDPDGERFDPELHEAMQAVPHADAAPDTVLTVVQKGLTLNGRLLRPARVIVARAPEDGSSGQGA